MRLSILGCGGGIGGARRTSSLLLDDDILIDAGTGVGDLSLAQMAEVDHVFLTHAHLDHCGFIPLLADAVAYMRTQPLIVHALPQTIEALKRSLLNGVLWPDYSVLPSPEHPCIRFKPVTPGESIKLGTRRIVPVPACHSIPAVGYQLDSGEASFVYSGDTTDCDPFWSALNGMDNLRYLMIEVTFLNNHGAEAVRSGHMTAELLARGLARLERQVTLLITHIESGREAETMAEVSAACGQYAPVKLEQGRNFEF